MSPTSGAIGISKETEGRRIQEHVIMKYVWKKVHA